MAFQQTTDAPQRTDRRQQDLPANLSRPRPCNEFAWIRPLPSVVPYSFPVQRSELSAKVGEAGSGWAPRRAWSVEVASRRGSSCQLGRIVETSAARLRPAS